MNPLDLAALIIQLTCRQCGCTQDSLYSHNREWHLVWARWCAWHLTAKYCPSICARDFAALFNRNRRMIALALKTSLPNWLATNPSKRAELDLIESHVLAHLRQPAVAASRQSAANIILICASVPLWLCS